jgi:hypothetical protein
MSATAAVSSGLAWLDTHLPVGRREVLASSQARFWPGFAHTG